MKPFFSLLIFVIIGFRAFAQDDSTFIPWDKTKIIHFRLYADNDEEMQFTYPELTTKQKGVLKIYNTDGRKLRTFNLEQSDTITDLKEREWLRGVYYYVVFVNNKIVYQNNIHITK
jgi:hypothetical protein